MKFSKNLSTKINNNLRQSLSQFKATFEHVVEDFSQSLDSVKTRRVLAAVAEPLMPLYWAFGMRVTHLNATRIEVLLPAQDRLVDEDGQMLEGVLATAAGFAYRTYWKQYQSSPKFNFQINSLHFERQRKVLGSIRLRLEVSEISREATLAEAIAKGKASQNSQISFYDELEQIAALVEINATITHHAELEWK